MDRNAKYLAILTATVVIAGLASLAVNVVVDPYGIHRVVSIAGVNAIKPAVETKVRLTKAYQMIRTKPEIVVLGNSRVESGIDTDLASEVAKRNIFNVGLPGSTIYELYRYLQHAQAIRPLTRAVLALDVYSFNTNWARTANDYLEERLRVHPDGSRVRYLNLNRIRDLRNLYLSISSLDSARFTVLNQNQDWASDRTDTGFNPMVDAEYYFDRGYHHVFFRKAQGYYRNSQRRGMNFAPSDEWPEGAMRYFRDIVAFCRREGIALRLYIHPYHAHVLEIMRMTGIWSQFEDWKRQVVAIVAEDADRHPDSPPIQIWDFSGYNAVTTEPVPPEGDVASVMRWYWEASHYKKAVGTEIVKVMYQVGVPAPGARPFGVRIDDSTIEQHLADIRAMGQQYRHDRAEEVADLEAWIR